MRHSLMRSKPSNSPSAKPDSCTWTASSGVSFRPGRDASTGRPRKPVRVEVYPIEGSFELPEDVVPLVAALRPEDGRPHPTDGVLYVEVSEGQTGLLFVDGRLTRSLEPGRYAFWRYQRNLKVKFLEERLQNVEVSGQEILTRDKVSLRINLTASYRIVDAEKAAIVATDFDDLLYKDLQFALREAVGTKTLDELLEGEGRAETSFVSEHVRERTPEYGVEVARVGVKDIILPGEMKAILNQVVEAEKAAEANLIRRREETAATRSLHNTARMMERNPTLLRLKELEALERVTDRVGNLTVFGGLEGVLQDMVRLRADGRFGCAGPEGVVRRRPGIRRLERNDGAPFEEHARPASPGLRSGCDKLGASFR